MSSVTRTTKHKHLHPIPPPCLTHCTTGHCGQLNTHYHQTTYPQSTYDMTTDYNKTDRLSPTTRKKLDTIHGDTESAFAQTTIHTADIIFTNIILVADKHNIP